MATSVYDPAGMSGPGLFGVAALEGYNQGLSNYRQMQELQLRADANQRAAQTESLQQLMKGLEAGTTNPAGMQQFLTENPTAFGGATSAIQSNIDIANRRQIAEGKLAQAGVTGQWDESDPDINWAMSYDPGKYVPMMQKAKLIQGIRQIQSDPNITDPAVRGQKMAQLMMSMGADASMFRYAYPQAAGATEYSTAYGAGRGGLQAKGEPLAGSPPGSPGAAAQLAGQEATERAAGGIAGGLRPAPGRPNMSGFGAEAYDKALNAELAKSNVALSPAPTGPNGQPINPRNTRAGAEADAKQTAAEEKARLAMANNRNTVNIQKMTQQEALKAVQGIQKYGFYADPGSPGDPALGLAQREPRTYDRNDLASLGATAKITGKNLIAPTTVTIGNERLPVFAPRNPPMRPGTSLADYKAVLTSEYKKWNGTRAFFIDQHNNPNPHTVTLQDLKNYYSAYPPPAQQ